MSSQRVGQHVILEDSRPLNYGSTVQDDDPNAIFGGLEGRKRLEKQLLRKVDLRVSFLIIIYIMNFMDRNNVAAARLHGFEEDLQLRGRQFNVIMSILYVGYLLMQVPSNLFLSNIAKPSLYLSSCMAIWGFISILTGCANDFSSVLWTRFFLGFAEAAFYPGALFLLSTWYKRKELGQRTALFSCGSLISNAFGSLVASGILTSTDGMLGFAAWRWLFYIEGLFTILVAACAAFILPDFPATSGSWLTPDEQALAKRRMEEDFIDSTGKPLSSGLVLALLDWKIWWLAVALASMVTSLSFNIFFPTLCATMGYSPTVTLLLCVPPWIFATVVALIVTRNSDINGERFSHIVYPMLIGIVGYLTAMSTMNITIRYFSLFLMAQSSVSFIVFFAWVSNSISHPSSKRAVGIAFINSIATLGNVGASYIWPSSWGPSYTNSYIICTLASLLCIFMCRVFRDRLAMMNKIAEAEEAAMGLNKGFRYIL